MLSALRMFHILPKLSKKFFRLFYVGSMITLQIGIFGFFCYSYFNNLQSSVLENDSFNIGVRIALLVLSGSTLLGAIVNSAETVFELLNKLLPREVITSKQSYQRGQMRKLKDAGTARLIWNSFVNADVVHCVRGTQTDDFSSTQAHKCVETDWPQLFSAGTEMTFAVVLFRVVVSVVLSRSRVDEAITMGWASEHFGNSMEDYNRVHTPTAVSYVFYAGVIFPLSIVLKGKMNTRTQRFVLLIYSLSAGALNSFFSATASTFYVIIAANFVAVFAALLYRVIASAIRDAKLPVGND